MRDSAFVLSDLNVSVSMYDNEAPDEHVRSCSTVAHEVVIEHLRKAKVALSDLGVNLNWTEEGVG